MEHISEGNMDYGRGPSNNTVEENYNASNSVRQEVIKSKLANAAMGITNLDEKQNQEDAIENGNEKEPKPLSEMIDIHTAIDSNSVVYPTKFSRISKDDIKNFETASDEEVVTVIRGEGGPWYKHTYRKKDFQSLDVTEGLMEGIHVVGFLKRSPEQDGKYEYFEYNNTPEKQNELDKVAEEYNLPRDGLEHDAVDRSMILYNGHPILRTEWHELVGVPLTKDAYAARLQYRMEEDIKGSRLFTIRGQLLWMGDFGRISPYIPRNSSDDEFEKIKASFKDAFGDSVTDDGYIQDEFLRKLCVGASCDRAIKIAKEVVELARDGNLAAMYLCKLNSLKTEQQEYDRLTGRQE